MSHRLIVIGCSWGGLTALRTVLGGLPADLAAAVVGLQHRAPHAEALGLARGLARYCAMPIRLVEDKDPIQPATVYLGPPDYHLLIEPGSFALSIDAHVQYSRPSIDVLFDSAADAYGAEVVGVILTGANADGAAGLRAIRDRGGYGIVQDPAEAERAAMPRAAIEAGAADAILPLDEIAPALVGLCRPDPTGRRGTR